MGEQLEGLRAETATRARGRTTAGDLIGLLEERIVRLVANHREARRTILELRAQLKDRDQRIGELNEKVYTLGRLRIDARKRVESLIAELDRLERGRGAPTRSRGSRS